MARSVRTGRESLDGPMPGVPQTPSKLRFHFPESAGGPGAGKVLAEGVTEGETEWDMWSCDPRRLHAYADRTTALPGKEVYGR